MSRSERVEVIVVTGWHHLLQTGTTLNEDVVVPPAADGVTVVEVAVFHLVLHGVKTCCQILPASSHGVIADHRLILGDCILHSHYTLLP